MHNELFHLALRVGDSDQQFPDLPDRRPRISFEWDWELHLIEAGAKTLRVHVLAFARLVVKVDLLQVGESPNCCCQSAIARRERVFGFIFIGNDSLVFSELILDILLCFF